jgi:hypothetical protein
VLPIGMMARADASQGEDSDSGAAAPENCQGALDPAYGFSQWRVVDAAGAKMTIGARGLSSLRAASVEEY